MKTEFDATERHNVHAHAYMYTFDFVWSLCDIILQTKPTKLNLLQIQPVLQTGEVKKKKFKYSLFFFFFLIIILMVQHNKNQEYLFTLCKHRKFELQPWAK